MLSMCDIYTGKLVKPQFKVCIRIVGDLFSKKWKINLNSYCFLVCIFLVVLVFYFCVHVSEINLFFSPVIKDKFLKFCQKIHMTTNQVITYYVRNIPYFLLCPFKSLASYGCCHPCFFFIQVKLWNLRAHHWQEFWGKIFFTTFYYTNYITND